MSYYEGGSGGASKIDVDSVVLTKDNIPMHFKSGYYKQFTATTDPSLLTAKRIVYTHHQHSTNSANETYQDGDFTSKNAKTVDSRVSSPSGCYTQKIQEAIQGTIFRDNDKSSTGGGIPWQHVWKCNRCGTELGRKGQRADGTWFEWGFHDASQEGKAKHTCGYNTYYVCGCGKSNGQLISADIYY